MSPDHQKYIPLLLYYYILTLFDQINESESESESATGHKPLSKTYQVDTISSKFMKMSLLNFHEHAIMN